MRIYYLLGAIFVLSGVELYSSCRLSTGIQLCEVKDIFHIFKMGKLRMRDILCTLPKTTDLVSDA